MAPVTSTADPGAIAILHRAMREGRTDPVGVLQVCLDRIDAVEASVNAFCLVDRKGAMSQAEVSRAELTAGRWRGPLHGIPVAIKDVIDVRGWPTRAGSRTRAGAPASAADAVVVAQLRAAGAIVLGKAHTTEFAYFDGPPPTRNPHDVRRTPGGSSAGPAAAVAAGMAPLSVGTQTAGSVSRPAAYCGIAAFKPSTLSWPAFGIVPFAPSFDTPGLFGYRTADATVAARALMPAFLRRQALPPAGSATIGIVEDSILDAASSPIRQSVRAAGDKLVTLGIGVEAWRSPISLADILAWHKTVTEFELGRCHGGLLHARDGEVTPALCDAIARGQAVSDVDYHEALRALDRTRMTFWSEAARYEALIIPAAPDVAPVGMHTGDPRFIIPFTALGGPIASIPIGVDQGLPIGLMLIGCPGRDWALSELADRLAPSIELPR